jgi:hypothetical protein
MPIGIPKGTILHYVPRTAAQDAEIRSDYARGDRLVDLQAKYHRGRIALNEILGIVPTKRHQRTADVSQATTITPAVQTEAVSPMAYVLAFEERTKEFRTIIAERTQERDEARNEVARLHVALTTAINGTKADLDQLQAAGKRVSSPLLSPLGGG